MLAMSSNNKIVLVAKQPFLFATINCFNVNYMARMLFEVFLEGAKLELDGGICEI